ncbi:MAG: alpha/beta fold hydrolase [Flavobacteriales bacterium]|nr:alpha/beta fold hydrolase [Flavobacteriales bacterium]
MQHRTVPTIALAAALVFSVPATAQQALTNQAIWTSRAFSPEMVGGLASMNDGEHYTVVERDGDEMVLARYAYRTGARVDILVRQRELVPAGSDTPLGLGDHSFSGDERKLMIAADGEPIYRYSSQAHHYVFDRDTRALTPLSDVSKNKQRLATFSPDGSKAAFVRDNDLYVVELATMQETRITTDGAWNKVLNGATDWVYEEEFTLVQGYAWSPKGTKLIYLRSDETAVPEFDMAMYQGQLYPSEYRFKYPKAGEVNSVVSLHVHDLVSGRTVTVPHDAEYIPRLGFTADDNVLWFMRMDRLQRTKEILTANLLAKSAWPIPQVVYKETAPTYVEVTDDLHFTADGKGFVLTTEQGGWNHVMYVPFSGSPRALTSGAWDVLEVKGIDERRKRVIFTAARSGIRNTDVLAVGLKGGAITRLSPAGGTNHAEFSTGFRYFINTRSTNNSVPVVTLHEGSGKQVKVLKENTALARVLKDHGVQPVQPFSAEVSPGLTLHGWTIQPPNMEKDRRYPVLITQYSGPNSHDAGDRFTGRNGLWFQMLAQQGYVVVCADPRGTGRRGRDFRHITYGQLGKYETEDHIALARWLQQQPYVDPARIGIWGWSYGGYMSSLCITKGADVFKAAIAVAPVSNWRYYDTIYTERYMGLPRDNAAGYDDNSPINHVEKLKGNYLIVHGLADDNVHYQNAAEMVNALVRHNKQFDQFMYPDRNHGIYGGTTRLHLFTMMTEWLERNL